MSSERNPNKHECPVCREEGLESTVSRGRGKTLRTEVKAKRFTDAAGNNHCHDPNCTEGALQCSNGHRWYGREYKLCPVEGCDWRPGAMAGVVIKHDETLL